MLYQRGGKHPELISGAAFLTRASTTLPGNKTRVQGQAEWRSAAGFEPEAQHVLKKRERGHLPNSHTVPAARPRGTPAQLRPPPTTPLCSSRHRGRGSGRCPRWGVGPDRRAWPGPRRPLARRAADEPAESGGSPENSGGPRGWRRRARLLLRGPASSADSPPPQPARRHSRARRSRPGPDARRLRGAGSPAPPTSSAPRAARAGAVSEGGRRRLLRQPLLPWDEWARHSGTSLGAASKPREPPGTADRSPDARVAEPASPRPDSRGAEGLSCPRPALVTLSSLRAWVLRSSPPPSLPACPHACWAPGQPASARWP